MSFPSPETLKIHAPSYKIVQKGGTMLYHQFVPELTFPTSNVGFFHPLIRQPFCQFFAIFS